MEGLYGKAFEATTHLDARRLAKLSFEQKNSEYINRLGWTLTNVKWLFANRDKIEEVMQEGMAISERFDNVIFCGMGGSGLGIQVVRSTFGESRIRIYSLRTTDPTAIVEILEEITSMQAGCDEYEKLRKALTKTVVVVITKSGKTKETIEHKRYFQELFSGQGIDAKEHLFIMTDPGSSLEEKAIRQGFAVTHIQLNDRTDIGGRYTSPTTRIFLLSLALVAPDRAMDILEQTVEMNEKRDIETDTFIKLGAYLCHMAKDKGRDKITFLLPKEFRNLSMWVEQLFEESLGKGGKGITIFYGERLGPDCLKDASDNDRAFLRINIDETKTNEELWDHLIHKGYPTAEVNVKDVNSIGGLMLGLQRTVATVAYLWDICFVDQPAVEGYKTRTKSIMEALPEGGQVQVPSEWEQESARFGKLTLYYGLLFKVGVKKGEVDSEVKAMGADMTTAPAVYAATIRVLRRKPGFEAAELAFYGCMTDELRSTLEEVRYAIFTRALKIPSKVGEGPDKNHSYQQNIDDGKNMFFSTYFLPLQVRQPWIKDFDKNLLKAQTIGTIQSMISKNRKCILMTVDLTAEEAAEEIYSFFKETQRYLENAEHPV
jgi:glucose-6-phosphate isomerase